MAENQTAGNIGTVQPVQTGGIITDPKILQGLTKAYNVNCSKLQSILGSYYLIKLLSGTNEYKIELEKIQRELKAIADKNPQKQKNGEDILSKEEKDSMFVADQMGVFPIYQAIYKRQLEQKGKKAKRRTEKSV
jgi:hypothetical protein